MKQIYFTLLFCLAGFGIMQAQEFTVVLAVDMNDVTDASETVSVAGNFQDDDLINPQGEWSDGGNHTLTDSDGDGIHTISLRLPAGTYAYKFLNGTAWGTDEGSGLNADCGIDDGYGNFNRTMEITEDAVLAFKFNSCDVVENFVVSTREVTTAASFQLAPNPLTVSSNVSIDNPENENLTLTVTDLLGKVISVQYNVANTAVIQRDRLQTGLYLVSLQNEQGARFTQKLVVR